MARSRCPEAVDVFVLALDNDKLPNPVNLHAIGTGAVPMKDVARRSARSSVCRQGDPQAGTRGELRVVGGIMTMAGPSSNEWTKEVLGWNPQGKDLIQQIGEWSY